VVGLLSRIFGYVNPVTKGDAATCQLTNIIATPADARRGHLPAPDEMQV
jgi:hypothetical protein